MSSFTRKEQLFIQEICVDWNATQAAIRAGYSTRSATSIGYENLRKPHIKTAIKERLKVLNKDSELAREVIVNCLFKEAIDDGEGCTKCSSNK